jgi:cell wall-associated NlpC family hydrolase
MATRAQVLRSGRKYLGVPYVSGTSSPCSGLGMDCDCFAKRTFNDLGIDLGWWTDQLNYGTRVSVANKRPGDLLFFSEDGSGYLTHVAIMSRDGKVLHASSFFGKVVESELQYLNGLYAVRRLI